MTTSNLAATYRIFASSASGVISQLYPQIDTSQVSDTVRSIPAYTRDTRFAFTMLVS
jgi:hypothetical protein